MFLKVTAHSDILSQSDEIHSQSKSPSSGLRFGQFTNGRDSGRSPMVRDVGRTFKSHHIFNSIIYDSFNDYTMRFVFDVDI